MKKESVERYLCVEMSRSTLDEVFNYDPRKHVQSSQQTFSGYRTPGKSTGIVESVQSGPTATDAENMLYNSPDLLAIVRQEIERIDEHIRLNGPNTRIELDGGYSVHNIDNELAAMIVWASLIGIYKKREYVVHIEVETLADGRRVRYFALSSNASKDMKAKLDKFIKSHTRFV